MKTIALSESVSTQPRGPHAFLAECRLRTLMTQHRTLVLGRLRRLGVPERELDDATQRVFWVIARKLSGIEPNGERAYLLGTAVRVAADVRRVESRRNRREIALDEASDIAAGTSDIVERKHAHSRLESMLASMPHELANVLWLAEAEELTAREIGLRVGIPAGTVASRLRRAREVVARRRADRD